eukprot:Amastigsp_a845385_5.p2 type:complete len:166 gc:universal Amastigsp_a845385_5:567-70(-)
MRSSLLSTRTRERHSSTTHSRAVHTRKCEHYCSSAQRTRPCACGGTRMRANVTFKSHVSTPQEPSSLRIRGGNFCETPTRSQPLSTQCSLSRNAARSMRLQRPDSKRLALLCGLFSTKPLTRSLRPPLKSKPPPNKRASTRHQQKKWSLPLLQSTSLSPTMQTTF